MRLALLSTLAALPALLPAPALAQAAPGGDDRVRWALCLSGEGCHTCQTTLSHAQADQALGALGLISDNPGHTVTVMRRKDGEWTWYYDTRRPPVELDRYFGGPGRGLQPTCAPVPGDHVPRDGQWTIANRAPVAKNCPAGVDRQVATIQLFRSGPVRFAKPFRAGDALPSADVKWLQSGPNQHVASFQPAGATGMRARYQLTVTSPEAMRGELDVVVPVPGQATCEVKIAFDYTRTGDLPTP